MSFPEICIPTNLTTFNKTSYILIPEEISGTTSFKKLLGKRLFMRFDGDGFVVEEMPEEFKGIYKDNERK